MAKELQVKVTISDALLCDKDRKAVADIAADLAADVGRAAVLRGAA